MLELTDANFEQEVVQSQDLVMVDFWAPWCGPCRVLGPVVEEIANEYNGKVKVAKLNVDDSQTVPAKFGIMSIPTIIFFKDGEEVERVTGAVPKNVLTEKLAELS